MATNFSPEATQVSEIGNAVSPKQGVSEDTTLLEGAASIFGGVVEAVKSNKKSGAISEFSKKQLTIIEGLESGQISSSRMATTRLRKNLMDAINAAGGDDDLIKEIINVHGKLRGFSNDLRDGTDAERRKREEVDRLYRDGLIDETTTEDQLERIRAEERARTARIRAIEDEVKAIDLELKRDDLSQSRRTELQEQRKDIWRDFTRKEAPRQLNALRVHINRILVDPNLDASEKQTEIENMFIDFEAQTVELQQVLGSEADAYMLSFNKLKENYMAVADGSRSLQSVKTENEMIKAQQEAILRSDPVVRFTAGVKELLGENWALQFYSRNSTEVHKALTDMLKSNSTVDTVVNPFKGNDRTNRIATKELIKLIGSGLESDNPSVQEESKNQLRNLIKSIEIHQGSLSQEAKNGIPMIEVLASDEFRRAIKSDPSLLDDSEKAKQALDMHFYDEVFAMVEQEFNTNNIHVRDVEGEPNALGFKPLVSANTPDAVTFEINDNIIEFFPINDDGTAKRKAEQLNAELAPIIRNLVKADAHLNGSDNYKQRAEQIVPFFVKSNRQQPGGGDEGDELNIDDFAFPTVSTGGLPAEVAEDTEFLTAVDEVAANHGISSEVLLAVMDFETGGTFNPAQKNAAGSSATGLIQFMAKTAKDLGTSTKELSSMTRAEQMQWVDRYLDQFDLEGASTSDVYMAVLFPKAIGKSDDFVLFRSGTKAYRQNAGLDTNKSGTVTKREAARKVVNLVGKHS